MTSFIANLPHLIMATVVIAAVTVLAGTGTITGNEALVVIAAAGGVSLGVGAGSTATPGASKQPVPPAPPA